MSTDILSTERQWLRGLAEGNEQVFRTVYESYVPRLTPFIRNLVQTESLVNDVIQQTFLALWVGREKLVEVQDAKAYIFRIAANTCYKILRRSRVEKRVFAALEGGESADTATTDDSLQVRELTRALERAIAELSPQRKKVYLLSRQQGLTNAEIAEKLELSGNTVRNTLSSALGDLRDHLIKNGYHLPVLFIIFRLL